MIQRMLAIWSLVPLPFLKPAWTSGSSRFTYYWRLAWRILNFTSVWDECNCVVVWVFFGIAFLWNWNENWPFPALWPLLSFPNLLAFWVHYFHSIIGWTYWLISTDKNTGEVMACYLKISYKKTVASVSSVLSHSQLLTLEEPAAMPWAALVGRSPWQKCMSPANSQWERETYQQPCEWAWICWQPPAQTLTAALGETLSQKHPV